MFNEWKNDKRNMGQEIWAPVVYNCSAVNFLSED